MDLWVSIVTIIVGVVAVAIAIWQGRLSKQQLDLARDTERRTEDTLREIRTSTDETRRVVQDIKNNIDERITRILDARIEADQQSQATSNAFSQALIDGLKNSMTQNPPTAGRPD